MQDIIDFLTLNGFTYTKDDKHNFTNSKCHIIVHIDESDYDGGLVSYYTVQTSEYFTHSPDLQIYWLIGYLTYYGYMDKDYKQLNFN